MINWAIINSQKPGAIPIPIVAMDQPTAKMLRPIRVPTRSENHPQGT